MVLLKQYNRIRLVLGDQLNQSHSWFDQVDHEILYVIAELPSELTYVKHHVQKICAFFAAMGNYAENLQKAGHHVLHLTLNETYSYANLNDFLAHLIQKYQSKIFDYQHPDEYRLAEKMQSLSLGVKTNCFDTEHFLLPFDDIAKNFPSKKSVVMESFYRKMRKRSGYLMELDKPVGGKWNYDASNRKSFKASQLEEIPAPYSFENDVSQIIQRLDKHEVSYFGKIEKDLLWPTSRDQSLVLLDYFCQYCLPQFGTFQDAMTANSDSAWSLYHSRLSFSLNSKMLSPKEVIEKAIDSYESNKKNIDIAQIEGFVRQILGWREYVRGMYWANMPDYQEQNYFDAKRDLPNYFWSGETKMACMKACIGQSLEKSYAHHIQRLMVIGNFCLLTGIDPDQVDQWYLGVYIDAIEWVEMPNTRGMSQFADGGLIATKPYCSSGSYINKMSDYCKSCHYQVKEKTSEDACPFNALYWYFLNRNKSTLKNNPRIGMAYRTWNQKFSDEHQAALLKRAEHSLIQLENL